MKWIEQIAHRTHSESIEEFAFFIFVQINMKVSRVQVLAFPLQKF